MSETTSVNLTKTALVTKGTKVTTYESIVVFNPELGEAQVKDEEKKIESILTNNGAQQIVIDRWGKKQLPYIVRKQRFGHFACFKYSSVKSDTVKNITSLLRITDNVIKFQTHRTGDPKRKFKGNPKRSDLSASEFYSEGFDSDY